MPRRRPSRSWSTASPTGCSPPYSLRGSRRRMSATMAAVTEAPTVDDEAVVETELSLVMTFVVAAVVGAALAGTARAGATALLAVIAVGQLLLALAWIIGTQLPGRKGAFVLAGLAAAGADIAVSVWPHDQLGPLLAVVGLAVPAMFVHQLTRGAARVQVVSSMSAVALLLLAAVALPALMQLRHEFGPGALGGKVTAAA